MVSSNRARSSTEKNEKGCATRRLFVGIIGVPPVIGKIFKRIGVILGVLLVCALVVFGLLVLNSADDKDETIKREMSPDGKLEAEIHQITTPMHGGPDTLRVTIASSGGTGDVVYSRTYECSDYSAFRLEWKSSNELTILYSECNASKVNTIEENIRENKVWQSDTSWRDVKINYKDTQYLATE
jgi:hypothetical protein